MKLSDLYPARQMDLALVLTQASSALTPGLLLQLQPTDRSREFWISAYGEGASSEARLPRLGRTDRVTADCLRDCLQREGSDCFLFLLHQTEGEVLRVRSYSFEALVSYQTPVVLQVPAKLWNKGAAARLTERYVSSQLGIPTLACMEQNRNRLQLLGNKHVLVVERESSGLQVLEEKAVRRLPERPMALCTAPEITFVAAEERADETALLDRLASASQSGAYLELWTSYQQLSQAYLKKEKETVGTIPYTAWDSRPVPEGLRLSFTLEEEPEETLLGRELGVELSAREGERWSCAAFVGTVQRLEGCRLFTLLENQETEPPLPPSGKLQLHTLGEERIQRRRQAARDRILQRKTPLLHLRDLLERGTILSGETQPLPRSLLRKYPEIAKLNDRQLAALELALGTPDIALIQGPPGCGKTTVIRLLCQCFRQLFEEAEQKKQELDPDYDRKAPRILITSFQNDAVDQAIAAPLAGELPACRKTAGRVRSGSRLHYQETLDRWTCQLREQLASQKTPAVETYLQTRQTLLDEADSYRNANMDPKLGAALLRHYLSFTTIPYPEALVREASELLWSLDGKGATLSELPEDPICAVLRGQRTQRETFADDGLRQVKRLLAHLRLREEGEDLLPALEAVCRDSVSQEVFQAYVEAVETLQARLLPERPRQNTGDEMAVNRCILELQNCFSRQAAALFPDHESKKALILQEFLRRLEQEREMVVQRYTNTLAATCQGALDLRDGNLPQYDLVVVDEAARANPLDLFIPLSMGKKLVLVGDHRQLPHMLEPALLEELQRDLAHSQLPELQVSLFQRLFDLLSKGPQPKALLLRQQYRMHPTICQFVSDAFYDGALTTAPEITPELRAPHPKLHRGAPLVFVSVPGSRGWEMGRQSRSRLAEAERIAEDVRAIFQADPTATVGVITFYGAQAALLRSELSLVLDGQQRLRVEVGTVDAFQGKEYDYVLLSCVRSNPPGKDGRHVVGFLDRPNRLCVAFSRAIRQLAVYGDPETLDQIPCFHALYEHWSANGGENQLEA